MVAFIRFSLPVCLFVCLFVNGYAGAIDSLTTKEQIQKFLVDKLGENGVISLSACADVTQSLRSRLYLFGFDTIMVEDPITNEMMPTPMPRDSSSLQGVDHRRSIYFPIENIVEIMSRRPWQFYKSDIDQNGLTDMAINIDSGGVIVVMDEGSKIEGHIPWDAPDFSSYSFKGFTSLPDGSKALLLRHHPCTLEEQTSGLTVSYVTDTISLPGTATAAIKIDTVYKIITRVDTLCVCPHINKVSKQEVYIISDTVDMKRYRLTDTVVFKNGGFAKYNPKSKPAGITKIGYYHFAYGAYQDCMEVNRNGLCLLQYGGYDTVFSANLDREHLNELWDFMSYVNSDPVFQEDANGATPKDRGGMFVIQFDDGTVKEMPFGRGAPPIGLGYLSKKLSDVSDAVNWQSSKTNSVDCPCKRIAIKKWSQTIDCDCRSIDMIED